MSNLVKEATRVVAPLINALLATTDDVNFAKLGATANRIMNDVHGTGRTITLTTITQKGVDAMRHDMSEDGKRLNFNIIYPKSLLAEIQQADTERQKRWRHFFTTKMDALCTAGTAKDRPVVLVEKLSNAPTYQVQLMMTDEGLRVAGIICLYGSSLNSWFTKSETCVSQCDYSDNPSTHYMDNKYEFAIFCLD
ncbi:hypothetical protein MYOV003v1_p0123 [Vibrio phage 207E48.1]|nr:hypothetical protein MYOV003v1_p0123 [Vibrio phage 207E48.1]